MRATCRFVFLAVLGLTLGLAPRAGVCGDADSKVLDKVRSITKGETIQFEATAFIRYWVQLQDSHVEGAGENEPYTNSFEIWRLYFGPKVQVTPWLLLRVTADVGSDSSATSGEADDGHTHKVPGSPRYGFFIKYAYAQLRFAPGLHLRIGSQANLYHEFNDKLWGGRYVAKNVGDEEQLWHSASLGLNLLYELPGEHGEIGVGFVNGSGYKKALDTDANKELWVQAALSPFASLGDVARRFQLAMLLQYDVPVVSDADQHLLATALVGWKGKWVSGGYQFIANLDDLGGDGALGMGHGAYLRLLSPWKVGLLCRAAIWDADTDQGDVQEKYEVLGGVFYSPLSFFEVALSASGTWYSKLSGVEEEPDVRMLLSTQFAL
ncbi:MAG: hypothetical protein ABIK09_19270 [Pseudomonadota bacterium]